VLSLENNLKLVQEKIVQAAKRAGRDPQDVTLLAVTKTVSPEEIEKVLALGQTTLAENRVQDALEKQAALEHRLPHQSYEMHLIGSLQRNKVRMVVGKFSLIHSVDRWSLARELDDRGQEVGIKVPVLIQVNVSGEETKHGLKPTELLDFCRKAKSLEYLELCGLMTMAPWESEPEETRPVFQGLRRLFQTVQAELAPGPQWRHLSMGMSNDYEVAIEEGATIVRVGTAIFHASKEGYGDEELG